MSYEDCLTAARAELRAARNMIRSELRDYPTPVSGCDAQYNHMVGMAGSITQALKVLEDPAFVATPRTLEAGAGVESR